MLESTPMVIAILARAKVTPFALSVRFMQIPTNLSGSWEPIVLLAPTITTGLGQQSDNMIYDPLRQALLVNNGQTVKVYHVNLGNCFGFQIGQFCSSCASNNDSAACSSCVVPNGFSLDGSSCRYTKVAGEAIGHIVEKTHTCCVSPKIYNPTANSCLCPPLYWQDADSDCQQNPTGCEIASDITGQCVKALVGYYIDDSSTLLKCSDSLTGCDVCEWTAGGVSCTSCLGQLSL